jgi:replication factor C subunit 2/4
LDEADAMTTDAQAALRRTMETHSNVTRFCLICNYVSKIIEPLTSRCAKFRFKPLEPTLVYDRLKLICDKEGLSIEDKCLHKVIEVSEGDLRKAINTLQTASRVYGDDIKINHITEIVGIIPDEVIDEFVNSARSGDFRKLENEVKRITNQAYSVQQLLSQVDDYLVNDSFFNDTTKGMICLEMGSIEKKLIDGADEYLQLFDLGCLIMKLSGNVMTD